jgi:hypothetical protein
MKLPITINNTEFATIAKAEEHARQISKAGVGTRLLQPEHDFMMDYFKTYHHDWINKRGVGIDYFYISKAIPYGTIGFKLVRIDGTEDDISYTISKIVKSNPKKDFILALRYLIRPQIQEYRDNAFRGKTVLVCPLTSNEVTQQSCHVDHHEPTFNEIAEGFIADRSIVDFEGLVQESAISKAEYILLNKTLEKDYYEYHQQRAKLRILSKTGNLSIAKKANQ